MSQSTTPNSSALSGGFLVIPKNTACPLGIAHEPSGHLLGHVLRFGRLLRLMGVKVNLSQILDLLQAFEVVPISKKEDFFNMARAILVMRHEDYMLFEQAFALYWRIPQPFEISNEKSKKKRPPKMARLPGMFASTVNLSQQEEEERREEKPSYSALPL